MPAISFCLSLNVLILTVFQEYLQYSLAHSHLSQFIVSGPVQTKLDGKYQSGDALAWVQTIVWCLIWWIIGMIPKGTYHIRRNIYM